MKLSKYEEISLRREALSICRDYLGGRWLAVSEQNFVFKKITGGLSNYIFKCSLPDYVGGGGGGDDGGLNFEESRETDRENDIPQSVILRVFGPHVADRSSEILKDSIISVLLAEWKLGPKVYAIKMSCRLEQFLDGEKLYVSSIREVSVGVAVAKVLAKFHGFDLPICKLPKWLFETIQNYLKNTKRYDFKHEFDRQLCELLIRKMDLSKELIKLKALLNKVKSPVVFCHNDAQPGNILSIDGRIKLIDYEYSAYNYRGFDFGNMFNEFMFDYSFSKYPFFKCEFDKFPSAETQILRSYLAEFNKIDYDAVDDEDVKSIMREAQYYSLASDFMWACWSIYMSFDSRLSFGYMEYAICRMYAYHQKKRSILLASDSFEIPTMSLNLEKKEHFKRLIESIERSE